MENRCVKMLLWYPGPMLYFAVTDAMNCMNNLKGLMRYCLQICTNEDFTNTVTMLTNDNTMDHYSRIRRNGSMAKLQNAWLRCLH